MNKNVLIAIVAVVVLGGGLLLLNSNSTVEAPETTESFPIETTLPGTVTEQEEAMLNVEDNMAQVSETTTVYTLTDASQASYVAQKEWLNQPTQAVEGVTTNVTGTAMLDMQNGNWGLNAQVDLDTLTSGSGGRDNDVKSYFSPTIATVTVDSAIPEGLELGQPFTGTVPVMLTINGVTQEVNFEVTAEVTEQTFSAQGTANINVNDFNVTAPNVLNLYTVNEIVELNFDVFGEA